MTFTAADFEKLGLFYLGRRYDLAQGKSTDEPFLYESNDLLTHAVCIGMTGSGKTGLCLDLIEEAAIDGVPVIAIDPKGDISNLLLTFPNLSKEEFLPWVGDDEAKRAGVNREAFAEQQARRWKEGLHEWNQDGQRIERLKASADFAVYTPGSTAGLPISIVGSLAAPAESVRDDRDAFKERINSTAGPLLAMLGIDADPLKSREHILLATILGKSWSAGKDLSMVDLIQLLQKPPFTTIGALDLESFYPAKERFEFAMAINNLLAAPGFDTWLQGDPLSIDKLLYTDLGHPKVSVISIAHLNDSERMFFVTLLLSQMVSWMRSQSGATSLRAILYMDEIFGYFPPVANPPSKLPLLTLLKQARAFGVGVVLATQNPVDLDYKGLSNTGTWFIGRLQTERDKMRVIDGLEGAATEGGAKFDRSSMERVLSGLSKRIFLVNNVHSDRQEIIESRWAMSYLRGPLTKAQIKTLMSGPETGTASGAGASSISAADTKVPNASERLAPTSPTSNASAETNQSVLKESGAAKSLNQSVPNSHASAASKSQTQTAANASTIKPSVPAGIPEFFLNTDSSGAVVYTPMVLGAASIRFTDNKAKLDFPSEKIFLAPLSDGPIPLNWSDAKLQRFHINELDKEPMATASYGSPPAAAMKPAQYKTWSKQFADWIAATQKFYLLLSPSTGQFSLANELERDFRIRLNQHATDMRNEALEELRVKYQPKIVALQDKIMRAQQNLDRERDQAKQRDVEAAISIGTTILGALSGRRSISRAASSAARGSARAAAQKQEIGRAEETLSSYQQQLDQLNDDLANAIAETKSKYAASSEDFETVAISPKKTNISVQLIALVWVAQ